jgi:hypothetical protein
MDGFCHQHFRLRILAFNGCHVLAAYIFGVNVGHLSKVGMSNVKMSFRILVPFLPGYG